MKKGMKKSLFLALFMVFLMFSLQACGSKAKGLEGTTWKITSVQMAGQEMPLEQFESELKFSKSTVAVTLVGMEPEEMNYTLEKDSVKLTSDDSDEVLEFKYDGKKMTLTDESGLSMVLEQVK